MRALGCAMLLGGLVAVAPTATAQDAPASSEEDAEDEASRALRRASARTLEGDHAAAARILREARRSSDDPRLDLALAEARASMGRSAEAARLLREVVRAGNPIVADVARQRLAAIEDRLTRIAVTVPDAPAGARVVIDGEEAATESGRVVRPVEPGRHRVELRTAHGDTLARARVEVAAGETEEITLRPVRSPREVARAAGARGSRVEPARRSRAAQRSERSAAARRPRRSDDPRGSRGSERSRGGGTPASSGPAGDDPAAETGIDPLAGATDAGAGDPSADADGSGDDWVPWVIGGAAGTVVVGVLVAVLAATLSASPTEGDVDPIFVTGGMR